jgi:hypothetical protein
LLGISRASAYRYAASGELPVRRLGSAGLCDHGAAARDGRPDRDMSGRAGQTKGVTVHQRGSTWSYRLDLEPHPLTGKRQRENRGGFETEADAWAAAMKSRQRHGSGRLVRASRRTVRVFFAEWLDAVGDSLKPSTRQNYADYFRAYVEPIIGDRRLQDVRSRC